MTIAALMTAPALTAEAEEQLSTAARRMHEHRVGSLVVVKEGVAIGILTERDLLRIAAEPVVGHRVADAMTVPVESVEVDLDPAEALDTMRTRGYRHMPVTGHGELVGVISLRDLARVATIGPTDVPRGLKGVVVADTKVGDVRGREGFYHYRQHSAVELAERRPLEDVWRLMIDGALPTTVEERDRFAAEVRPLRHLPEVVAAVLPAIARTSTPLDGLRTALSHTGAALRLRPVYDLNPAERRRDALLLCAVAPTIVAALHRLGRGQEPVQPRDDLGHAANYLWMLTGQAPDDLHAQAIDRYLITTIDHGFNASTFTGRVVASTGADIAACVVAAVGALGGPLHGGAPSRALDLLDDIGLPARVTQVVREKVLAGERIMGFGHAVYKTDDPRSVMLREVARELGGPLADLAIHVEQAVVDALAELKPGRQLYANVEFYAGVVMATCGVPPELFTPTFACSRVIGWCANVLEQAADPKIIRPSARYVGPPPPQAVPELAGTDR